MAEPLFTDADVELVWTAWWSPTRQASPTISDMERHRARAVLEALTAAGWRPTAPTAAEIATATEAAAYAVQALIREQVANEIAAYFDGWAAAAGAVHADAMVESWHEAARLARQVGSSPPAPGTPTQP